MAARPKFAFKVNDLAASIAFGERLTLFTRAETQPQDADTAYMLLEGQDLLLLAGPSIQDVHSLLDAPRIVFKPGDTLDFSQEDLAAWHTNLIAKGCTDVQEEEAPDGSHRFVLYDPNGYKLVFYQIVKRTPEETVALYIGGCDELEALVAHLSDEQLELSRAPGEWTIRQIVNHLGDSDALFLMTFKTMLAQPGSTFVRPPYDQEHWVEALDNKNRAIGPSLALTRAARAHIVQLLQHVPDPWDRSITVKYSCDDEGGTVTLGGLLGSQAGHLKEHCNEIRETLQNRM